MSDFIQVSTTVATGKDAEKIAGVILEKRLAACVQVIGPISSRYWWKGKVEEEQEWLCLMKTCRALYRRLEETIRSVHPYEEPEMVALPIVEGSEGYLRWIEKETEQ